jgi:metal-responsive CopG/Arc/MetJ family transcriptional regulator
LRKKVKNKKISISITLDSNLLDIVNEQFSNRSKFLENCIIEELCKNDLLKEELKNKKIIL